MSDASPSPVRDPRASRFGFFLTQGLVIVVSVLFALAVDRLVMQLDESALERRYLQGLLEDFTEIKDATARDLAFALKRDTAAALVLATVRGAVPADVDGLQLAHALELSGWVLGTHYARATWDDMTTTGRLALLENAELRREIAAFYRLNEQLLLFQAEWVEQLRPYSDIVRALLEPELVIAIGRTLVYEEAVPTALAPDAPQLSRTVTGTPELRSRIAAVVLINRVSVSEFDGLDERAGRILEALRAELGD